MRLSLIALALATTLILGCDGQTDSAAPSPATASVAAAGSATAPSPEKQWPMTPPTPIERVDAKVETHGPNPGTKNVYVDGIQITHLDGHNEILAAEVSPSGRYLLVWYRDMPPLKLAIYDLETRERIALVEPGYGGWLRWAGGDRIYHRWGCGSNCSVVAVYDHLGRELFAKTTSGNDLDDSGRYIIISPSMSWGGSFYVIDVQDGRILVDTELDGAALGDRWLDESTLEVSVIDEDANEEKVIVTLDFDSQASWTSD